MHCLAMFSFPLSWNKIHSFNSSSQVHFHFLLIAQKNPLYEDSHLYIIFPYFGLGMDFLWSLLLDQKHASEGNTNTFVNWLLSASWFQRSRPLTTCWLHFGLAALVWHLSIWHRGDVLVSRDLLSYCLHSQISPVCFFLYS